MTDEPTSGMDITSKREPWNFLKITKQSKLYYSITRSLEKADLLLKD